MSQIGIGAMLHVLGGGSKHDPSEYIGKLITAAEMIDDGSIDKLKITFDDGKNIYIWDDGQSCCEHRYMTTDDDVSTLVGGELLHIETKEGPYEEGEYGDVHETVFVEVATDKGFITITTHNQHNGYYGGFGLTITTDEDRE